MFDMEHINEQLQCIINDQPTLANGFDILTQHAPTIQNNIHMNHFYNQLTENYTPFEQWLNHVLTQEPAPTDISAFYFGLFETKNDIQLYIIGSSEWSLNNDDWATNDDYVPEHRYPNIPLFNNIYALYDDNVYARLLLTITSTIIYVNTYITSNQAMFPNGTVFATGFDDGDLYSFTKTIDGHITGV